MLKRLSILALSSLFILSCSQDIQIINSTDNINTFSNPNIIKNNLRAIEGAKLQPDGQSKFEYKIKLTDEDGKALVNTIVDFSVVPVSPGLAARDIEEIAKKYGSSATKFRQKVKDGSIKLIGTVEPKIVKTDSEGYAKTIYTTSHIGSNDEKKAVEKIVAKYNNKIIEENLEIGYDDLIPLPVIEGALRIGDVTGKYIQKDIGEMLLSVGNKIKNEKWGQPLTITAGTLRWGGLYPPHFTHRRGGSLDFRPMSTDGNPTFCNSDGTFAPNYDRAKTLELLKIFKNSGAVEIFFNDPEAAKYGAKVLAGHHNHLHASWLESETKIRFNKVNF